MPSERACEQQIADIQYYSAVGGPLIFRSPVDSLQDSIPGAIHGVRFDLRPNENSAIEQKCEFGFVVYSDGVLRNFSSASVRTGSGILAVQGVRTPGSTYTIVFFVGEVAESIEDYGDRIIDSATFQV